jgi:hypothetical protein
MLTLKAFDDLLFRSISPFFSDDQFARLLLNLLGSLEYDDARPTINMEKLVVINSILSGSSVVERPTLRSTVVPVLISEIHMHLSKSTSEFAKCMELMAVKCCLPLFALLLFISLCSVFLFFAPLAFAPVETKLILSRCRSSSASCRVR